MRSGRCLGMTLEAERWTVGALESLQRAVEQRDVSHAAVGWKRGGIDRKTMVLRGDHHLFGVEVLHWMVRAMVAEFHLDGFGT